MALFGSQKDTKKQDESNDSASNVSEKDRARSQRGNERRLNSILKQPRVTEKATRLAEENNVYTFVVDKDANKQEIKKAVKEFYDVVPADVRTVTIPEKKIRQRRGKGGTKSGGKKAYVTLAEGDSIELL